MSLINVGGNARLKAALVVVGQYHTNKGVAFIGPDGKPLVYVEEKDCQKGIAMMKSVNEQIFSAKSSYDFIGLNDYAFISAAQIGAITNVPGKGIFINNNSGEVMFCLKEKDNKKNERIYSEICKAYDSVNGKKPHIIDWPVLMKTAG
jgi:hypothetical protein